LVDLGDAVGEGDVELAKVLDITDRKSAAEARGEGRGQCLDHRLAVLGPVLATLHALDDLPPDVPVGEDHLAVHRPDDARAGVLEDGDDALEEGVGVWRRDGRDGGGRAMRSALAGRLLHGDFVAGGRGGWATRGSAGGGSRRVT
jgi:hypothetical protein